MTTTGKVIAWGVVAILIIWGISSMSGKKGVGGEASTIKIGVILPLTGDAAVYGEPGQNVIALAADEINQAGGVNSKPLQMIFEDGKCSGPSAASAAQKLVNADKVQVIIGGFCSSESLAAEPIATAARVLLFSPGSSSPDLTGKSQYFVRNYPSDSTQGKVLADVSYNDKGWKTVAFMQEQLDYPLGIYKAFDANFSAFGGKTLKEEFPSSTTDFRSSLTKLKAQNPDALFIDTQTPAVAMRILKQMTELKWKVPLLVSDAVTGDAKTVLDNKVALEDTLGAEFSTDPNNPTFKHLLDAYKAKYSADTPYQSYGQTEYDSVYILAEGIKAVGNNGQKLSKWIRTLKDWDGASGKVTIGSNGDVAGGHVPKVIKNGAVMLYTK
ncbi:MAG: branched-chain amino acid transport system substrate-binding protein [Parcubacteria group bacterium Gr01-1014_24]|nr:MAG: branched-chain amino acid transport system substrate-binding protein [Parcubacteria group bacterium Gr01-1014_24]